MAKIVDPDQLSQGTEVVFDAGAKTITLAIAGNLDDDAPGKSSGVTLQALYSFTKEEWLATSGLRKVRFPFKAVFEAKFELINSWQFGNAQSRQLIRDAGFREVVLDDEYACIISLGSMDDSASDLAYYQQVAGFDAAITDFDKTGELNECIRIFDGTNNYRGFGKFFLRELNKTFAEGNLIIDQDLSALTYQAYRLPLANALDPNYTQSDATIDGSAPYTNFRLSFLKGIGFTTWANAHVYPAGSVVLDPNRQSGGSSNGTWWFTAAGGTSNGTGTLNDVGVTWEAYVGGKQIGTEWFAFNRIIHATSGDGTILEYYNWAQRQLRKTSDINADLLGTPNQDTFGTVNGKNARLLLDFIGVDLVTKPGVFVDNLDSNDVNNIKLNDITVDGGGLDSESVPLLSTTRSYPFVSAFTIEFATAVVSESDVNTYFTMFFQYTKRHSKTDLAVTVPSGDHYTLTSATLNLTTAFTNGDYTKIAGFANAQNNGYFRVSAVLSGSMTCTRVDGQNVGVAEGVGPTVTLDENPYDTPDAIVVNDSTGTPIAGQVTAASIAKTFDYDNNVQGGRTSGTDAPVAIEVSGLVSTWIDGLFTITASTGVSFPLNPVEDAVYLNP